MFNRSLTAMLKAILHLALLSSYSMAQAAPGMVQIDFAPAADTQSQNPSTSLAGTSWQLVKFQSSDDKTITPDVKSKYTIAFGSDGRASVRLDCNRGSGTYESKEPNQLEFGRFTVTLMMCPPGSLHNRIARDLGAVRSYLIKDGHLFLSLMADGGIYEFEPLGGPQSSPDESLFGRRWRLTEIRGSAVSTNKPYIELVGETKRFSGDGGCNRISGSFALNGESLRFLQIISTRRACLDPAMQQIETNFLKGLEDSFLYKLESDVLQLYAGDRLLLTFKADGNEAKQEEFVTGTVTYAQSSAVTEALHTSYGSAVEAVTGFAPFYLTGDFNGDAMQDIVIVVRIKEQRTALPKDVRLVNPFWYGPKVTFPTDLTTEPKLALAIIHGWKITKSATKFLLVGAAPPLIFDYGRTSYPESAKGLMELMSKRGKRPRGLTFPRTAKGDVILLSTQVGDDDTPLYWNGRTYKWEEGGYD